MLTRNLHMEQRKWSPEMAFQFCEQLASNHYENFPVASFFIPRDKRRYIAAIYAFARIADDFADEPGLTPAERIDSLNDWEEQLMACVQGEATHPVFIAVRETIERFEIPWQLLRNLLQAFRTDVTMHRYESFESVLEYCRFSANPVGRLLLLLFNYRSESMLAQSDAICTALQLTNFWQDIAVDLEKDRVYIPLEDLREFGYTERDLFQRRYNKGFHDLLRFEVERTERLFQHGKPLLNQLGNDLRLEIRMTWNGGMQILRKIHKQNYDVFKKRPTLTKFDKAKILLTSLRA
ncbi:MAG: squalene synthase HpnC [bacterium]